MKNFWEVITGSKKASPEELAGAIVDLSRKIEEGKQAVETAEDEALILHQKRIAGEKITDGEIETAERKVNIAQRNQKAAVATLENIQLKFKQAVEDKIKKDFEDFERDRIALKEKAKEAHKAYIKAYAAAKALSITIGGEELRESPLVVNPQLTGDLALLREEVKLLLSQQPKPTIYEETRRFEGRRAQLKEKTPESVMAELLEAARNAN